MARKVWASRSSRATSDSSPSRKVSPPPWSGSPCTAIGRHATAGLPGWGVAPPNEGDELAVIDVAGYVADLKSHAVGHGFHVHDERHFLETYSLRQNWEVDLHPEEGCGGPVDLHLALEVDPRTLLAFEDAVNELPEDEAPPDGFLFSLTFTWVLPPLEHGPDLRGRGNALRSVRPLPGRQPLPAGACARLALVSRTVRALTIHAGGVLR